MAETKQMPTSVPAVATNLLNIRYALETGDKTKAEIERAKLDAKLSEIAAKNYESQYNTVNTQYKKALDEVLKLQKEKVALEGSQALDLEEIKQKGDTHRKGMDIDAERETRESGEAHDMAVREYETTGFIEGLRAANIPEDVVIEILKARNKVPQAHQKHESEVVFDKIFGNPNATFDEKMAQWNAYNKIQPPRPTTGGTGGTRRTGSGSDVELTQTERETAGNVVLDTYLKTAPLQTTDINKPGISSADETTSRNPTAAEYRTYVLDMMEKARQLRASGLTPQHLSLHIQNEMSIAYNWRRETGGHDAPPAGQGGVEFEKPAEEYDDPSAAHAAVEQEKRYQKIVNLFESEAGKYFLDWLQESAQKGYYVTARMPGPAAQSADSGGREQRQSRERELEQSQQARQRGRAEMTPEEKAKDNRLLTDEFLDNAGHVSKDRRDVESGVAVDKVKAQAIDTNPALAVGATFTYTGPKVRGYKQLLYPNKTYRVLGYVVKNIDNHPHTGVLVESIATGMIETPYQTILKPNYYKYAKAVKK